MSGMNTGKGVIGSIATDLAVDRYRDIMCKLSDSEYSIYKTAMVNGVWKGDKGEITRGDIISEFKDQFPAMDEQAFLHTLYPELREETEKTSKVYFFKQDDKPRTEEEKAQGRRSLPMLMYGEITKGDELYDMNEEWLESLNLAVGESYLDESKPKINTKITRIK